MTAFDEAWTLLKEMDNINSFTDASGESFQHLLTPGQIDFMNERARQHELKQPGNPGDPLSWENTVGRPSSSYSIRNRNRDMKRRGAISPSVPLNMNTERILENQYRRDVEGKANPLQSHFYSAINGRRIRNPHSISWIRNPSFLGQDNFKRDVQ